jgi:Xaa-Pro aminopeptidase
VYEIVDAARRAAVAVVSPGVPIASVHEAATKVLVDGLIALGVLTGNADDLIADAGQKPYFPHQTSHWLGLDVHDPGDYARGGVSRLLEPGMVFTVEPGLYFGADQVDTRGLAGIGVRIEDDVVVTADGCAVLTSGLPTAIDEVEALVGASP